MGTNYYLKSRPCDACGYSKNEKHIGKQSCGWEFHFRGYRDESIVDFDDWVNLIDDPNKQIVNEYGEVIDKESFKEGRLISLKNGLLNHYNVIYGLPMNDRERAYCADRNNHCGYTNRGSERNCWKDKRGFTFTDNEFS